MGAGRSQEAAGNDPNVAEEAGTGHPLKGTLYGTAAGGIRPRIVDSSKVQSRGHAKTDVFTWLSLFLMPHILFSLMMFSVVFYAYTKSWQFYACSLFCISVPLDYGFRGWTADPQDEKEYKRVRYDRFYAIVTAAGALFGVLAGYAIYTGIMHQYYAVHMGEIYTNVVPMSRAAEFADATIIQFDSSTRVDTARSVGYVSTGAGAQTFCAAPVMGPHGLGQADVQFWSVGEDCCGHRGMFECGALTEADTRIGKNCLVELRPDPDFHNAISLSSAENGLHSADNAMLCRFVENVQEDLTRQRSAANWALAGSELLAFLVGGFVAQTYSKKFA